MKNTHIEHPEDTILTGDLSFLDSLRMEHHLSTKIDGAPAIRRRDARAAAAERLPRGGAGASVEPAALAHRVILQSHRTCIGPSAPLRLLMLHRHSAHAQVRALCSLACCVPSADDA